MKIGGKNPKSRARMLMRSQVSMHVETVVLLSQRKADDYIEVELKLDELDATSAETKATYEEIKKYVAEHNEGMKVSNLILHR